MRNTTEIDYITDLLLSIIELNESIMESVTSYDDLLVERDVLISTYEKTYLPKINKNEDFALTILKDYMTESTEETNSFVSKRETIKLIKS